MCTTPLIVGWPKLIKFYAELFIIRLFIIEEPVASRDFLLITSANLNNYKKCILHNNSISCIVMLSRVFQFYNAKISFRNRPNCSSHYACSGAEIFLLFLILFLCILASSKYFPSSLFCEFISFSYYFNFIEIGLSSGRSVVKYFFFSLLLSCNFLKIIFMWFISPHNPGNKKKNVRIFIDEF